jgi:hypothetical protein
MNKILSKEGEGEGKRKESGQEKTGESWNNICQQRSIDIDSTESRFTLPAHTHRTVPPRKDVSTH